MVTKLTNEERNAAAMLLGPEWSYGALSHTFIKGEKQVGGMVKIVEYRCADTLEVLTTRQVNDRRAAERQRQKEEIDANIKAREEARTHEEGTKDPDG